MRVPNAGDIGYIDFYPQRGREQARRRPALVLSPMKYNEKVGLAVVVPVTSKVKNYPFEIPLAGNSPVQGVALADQLRSCDWRARRYEFVCTAGASVLRQVRDLIGDFLAI